MERNKLSIKDTRLQEISDNIKKIGIPSQYPAYTNIFAQQFKKCTILEDVPLYVTDSSLPVFRTC
jgi:hypothetical protein